MILVLIAAYILMLVGGLLLVIAAFRQSVLWGLGCIFLPIVSLIFLFAHWQEAKKGFLTQLVGVALFVAYEVLARRTGQSIR